MRRLIFIIPLIAAMSASGQNKMVGIDIYDAMIENCICLDLSHGLTKNWSAEARTHLDLKGMKKERPHWSIETGIRYWPGSFYKGVGIGTGISYAIRGRPDCYMSICYSIGIWKGITATIAIRTKVTDTYQRQQLSADSINMELNYVF